MGTEANCYIFEINEIFRISKISFTEHYIFENYIKHRVSPLWIWKYED